MGWLWKIGLGRPHICSSQAKNNIRCTSRNTISWLGLLILEMWHVLSQVLIALFYLRMCSANNRLVYTKNINSYPRCLIYTGESRKGRIKITGLQWLCIIFPCSWIIACRSLKQLGQTHEHSWYQKLFMMSWRLRHISDAMLQSVGDVLI